jgi:hypothetical protein
MKGACDGQVERPVVMGVDWAGRKTWLEMSQQAQPISKSHHRERSQAAELLTPKQECEDSPLDVC